MADTEASGKGDVKDLIESSASFPRPEKGRGPNSEENAQGEYEFDKYDCNWDHNPSTSVNPPITSSSSKFIHPFMLERFIDDDGDTRLRIYGGYLYHCVNTINFKRTKDDDDPAHLSGPAFFMHVDNQPSIVGFTQEDVTGFSALTDDDGEDTVHTAKEWTASDSYGDYYLQWQVAVDTDVPTSWPTHADSAVTFVDFTSVTLYRTVVGAGPGHAAGLGPLTTQGAGDTTDGGATPLQLRRGNEGGSSHIGTYYAKIGTSYDPDHVDTKSKTIEQVLFNHVFWSPTIVAESE